MSATTALARRELFGYLYAPGAYLIAGVFMLFSALLYFVLGRFIGGGFNQGEPASMRLFFTGSLWVFLFIGPAISMRALADEYRQGTIEPLMCCPIRERQVIIGKFLGGFGFLALMLVPTVVCVVALVMHGRPDYGEIACGYVGLLLAGGAFIATGLLFSTFTPSQVLAYLMTLFFWLIMMLTTKGAIAFSTVMDASVGRAGQPPWIDRLLELGAAASRAIGAADPHRIMSDFALGLVDTFNVFYFMCVIALALWIATLVLQTRRWR